MLGNYLKTQYPAKSKQETGKMAETSSPKLRRKSPDLLIPPIFKDFFAGGDSNPSQLLILERLASNSPEN